MRTDFQEELVRRIGLPERAAQAALYALCAQEDEVLRISRAVSFKNLRPFRAALKRDEQEGAVLCLAAALRIAEKTYAAYRERGISDSVFYDTISDIAIWTRAAEREKGVCGLLEVSWIRESLFLNLFRLGRLQYQFFKTDYRFVGIPRRERRRLPLPDRSFVLNIHIPAGGRLDPGGCRSSLAEARRFFAEFFPEYEYAGFTCVSWLLDPQNREFMAPQSNILQFFTLFDAVVPTRLKSDLTRWVWGESASDPEKIRSFAENTDLQRRAKSYLLAGGRPGVGYGFIRK